MASLDSTDDLAAVAALDERQLVDGLQERFEADRIYTYIGDVVLMVNPLRPLALYGAAQQQLYTPLRPRSTLPPHTYAAAAAAYHALRSTGASQCFVISGESGAGKTESAKHIVSQLVHLCQAGSSGAQLQQRILQVGPLLEAFGNAVTLMNYNSSRFGKYTELLFDSHGRVVGATLTEYLLEKSRVVGQAPGEQNFHIFYYMLAHPQAAAFQLNTARNFAYLAENETEDLAERFSEVHAALQEVGFEDTERQAIYSMLAAILHLGNIEFEAATDGTASMSNASRNTADVVAALLLLDAKDFSDALLCSVNVTRGEIIEQKHHVDTAKDTRDATAKAIYGRLFGWLVSRANELLGGSKAKTLAAARIGILDIFGFEHFEKNGFEQCCINLANEQLQHFFNEHIFAMELEEYKREAAEGVNLTFPDNAPLLSVFLDKPMGLLALLDEESMFPKSTSESLVAKYIRAFNKHSCFERSRTDASVFTLRHYAGPVTYSADNFLKANRDNLAADMVDVLRSSQSDLVSAIFLATPTRTGSLQPLRNPPKAELGTRGRKALLAKNNANASHKRPLTIGAQFANSLASLVKRMRECRPHFIRCIKPNTTKEPWLFDSDFVLTQLRYIGLLETIRIRREGYAFRPTHHDFVRDYRILAFNPLADVPPTAASCDRILKTANICDYKLGRTKVFLKYFHYEELQRHLDGYHQATTVLTKIGRGFCVRNQARLLRRVSLMQQEQLEAFFELAAVCSTSTQRHVCQLVEADTQTRSQLLLQQHRQTEAKEAAVRQAAACELQQRLERLEANRKAAEAEAQQLARRHEEERQRQLAQEALLLQQAAERTRKEEEQAEADGDEDNNADDENEGTHRSLAVDTGPQAQLERKRREAAEQARRDSHRWQEREQAEQQRYASAVQTLRQQQQQRAQTEAAARTEREATEQKMAGKKQWQALATAQQAARNKAEEELATERNQREALQLQVLHQSDVTIRLSSQIEELRKQLRNAAQAQETAEDELAETQGLLVREQLRRQNAEELARHLQLEGTGPVGDGGEVAGLAGSQRRESQSRRAQALRMLAAAHNNGNTALPKTVGDRASETASKAEITDELLAQVNLAAYLRRRLGTLCAKPEEVVLGPAAISGYLMKQGSVNPSYQRRWFVLHLQKQVLRYFVDDTLKEHRGDIPLSDILFVGPDTSAGDGKKGSAAFSLVLGTAKRNYHLRAKSSAAMWTWQEALRICMPSGTQYGPVAQYGDFTVDRDAMQMAYENMVAAMQSRTEALEKELTVELMRNQEAERKLEVAQRKMQQQDTAGRQMEAQQVSNMMSHARTYTTTSDSRKMSEDSESANACLLRQLIHVDVNQRDKAAMDQASLLAHVTAAFAGATPPHDVFISKLSAKGFLSKQGDLRKTWKLRWFVLDLAAQTLSYYTDERPTATKAGEVALRNICKVVVPQQKEAAALHTLLVVTPSRTYQLRASNAKAMLAWYHCFLLCCPDKVAGEAAATAGGGSGVALQAGAGGGETLA